MTQLLNRWKDGACGDALPAAESGVWIWRPISRLTAGDAKRGVCIRFKVVTVMGIDAETAGTIRQKLIIMNDAS